MKLSEKLAYIAGEVKKVEAWAEDNNSSYWFDQFVSEINYKLNHIRRFAQENNIPFIVDAEDIARKNYDDTEGYSEEESSSFYEDESSNYDESEYEEEEDDEETEESSYY
jgi:hypothetical protein